MGGARAGVFGDEGGEEEFSEGGRSPLERLRKDYAKKVKEVRRAYAHEVDLLRAEKERRDEARREAARVANEQRKKEKAAAAESRAVERRAFEEEFRQMLMKERAQKLESWRGKEEMREKKKEEERELLRKQTSVWVSEENMENRMLEALVDSTPL
ncbi:uncharacterized protein A4U43_C10F2790 [Asparagus officinalis]|uniref:Uncharacterized protein n=1 Tax=Asparagus officinalis TaxID=4686 RepID=A0A5P1E0G2_ASPOF|nr:uncharacterized protein A4U43_C10F2790 [Asparagus officinalis]